MNWAAWVLAAYFVLGFVVGIIRMAMGRKAAAPPEAIVAVLTTLIMSVYTGGLIYLVILAATL